MKLVKFKVEMYRPILDSQWVNVDDITVIVGKNESGKTALLRALHKFNPFDSDVGYNLDRDWPRGHRKSRVSDRVVVRTYFNFSSRESEQLSDTLSESPLGVEISRTYNGDYQFRFEYDPTVQIEVNSGEINQKLTMVLLLCGSASDDIKHLLANIMQETVNLASDDKLVMLRGKISSFCEEIDRSVDPENQKDDECAAETKMILNEISRLIDLIKPRQEVEDLIKSWMPVFIYMDDHKPFRGRAYLDQIKARRDSGQQDDEDRTFQMLLEMAGLNLDTEYRRATESDREQRMLDMNDASLTLTDELADHWSQRQYIVKFIADGYHLITFVSDNVQSALVPLEERSKGFQWFFSFDSTFLFETGGTFKNAIILLDEPGLHLHASAQADLLARIKEYAGENQLIYTTHLPFMIDTNRLDNLRICNEDRDQGTTVSENIYGADKDARFPLQAALGLSMSQSLFVGKQNLVVEGVTDFWLIQTMSETLRSSAAECLDEQIVVTPAGGATKAAYVSTILRGQELDVIILLDSDKEGRQAKEKLIHQRFIENRQILSVGQAIGREVDVEIEDLFPDEFYLKFVNEAYRHELNGTPLTIEEVRRSRLPRLVQKISDAFLARDLKDEKGSSTFRKGRVDKRIMSELPKIDTDELPSELVNNFSSLFSLINQAMIRLTNRTA